MFIDELARAEAIPIGRLQENAACGRGRLCGKKVLLAKPMTFMNNSGECVGKLARFYQVRGRARRERAVPLSLLCWGP